VDRDNSQLFKLTAVTEQSHQGLF